MFWSLIFIVVLSLPNRNKATRAVDTACEEKLVHCAMILKKPTYISFPLHQARG